ncbi:D-methionine transport system substrate-binding protein [Ruminococcus sp. YE71]|uniref:MetQ/NlpA family ABC transporter substrate-binding protein n=1 Tax=unclassified Ruminococcus TaxID=2608920 RepID=UPI00088B50F5|nr:MULTISPECIES: MetQ/NlpA family ABC transporter substrate-binding protein [unclassified Ruminococcus]SDA09260.1 D-methionine transport system substrate-binding protein [Ruminococcus sp. YE78]SFW12833.1 D-methionine transport system substrate-binding protein [Ruminococcus sp. YE71]
MKTRRILAAFLAGALAATVFAGCGKSDSSSSEAEVKQTADGKELTVIKGLADLTPHSEILEYVEPELNKKGYTVDIVSTASDATWNEKTENGEVDFNFMQHEPYLIEWNEINNGDLVNIGNIHVEPIAAYSEKYTSADEVPDGATIVIPDDATNEYRALRILEQQGWIKLGETENARASVADITEFVKPIEITELDSYQINAHISEFDVYINNTNKVIEAGLDATKFLFREGEDSPYANIIVTTPDKANDPGLKALVEVLQSEDTAKFILEKYNGAVIPVTKVSG